ncbi:proton-conducting transporter membrane subunit [Ramlibacter sp. AN1015]|uniref:complex I subunit 5 family protein n=1 Tax=Ramlibacter sp. AN1015 TaxID=3133428 RepID=UPI0030C1263C
MAWSADAPLANVPWAALVVALPLLAALVASVSLRAARLLALPVGLLGLLVTVAASVQVAMHGPSRVHVGGWWPPLGIALRLDGLGCALLVVSSLVALGAFAAGRSRFGAQAARQAWAFWPLSFCLLAALNAAFVGADLFNLYVALELLTISAVALVALEGSAAAVAAALRYLLFALVGSLAYLLGVVLLYARHATLDLQALGQLPSGGSDVALAAALISVGLMAKGALFPLHGWLAPAHAAAPAPASALLSALVVKAPFLVLLRVWFEALPALPDAVFSQLLGVLGAGAIVLGSWLALRQERLKLVVAYSTVAQLGYLLLVFPLAAGPGRETEWAAAAWTGVAFHALAHALAKAAMFLAAGDMAQALGHDRVAGLAGLGGAMPLSAFAFALAAVSLMGLPPSGGFTGKYLLLTAALGSGQWWWAAVMLAGGLFAAAYLFRPLSCMLADARPELAVRVPRRRQAVALALAFAAVVLGLLSAGPFALLAGSWPGEAPP